MSNVLVGYEYKENGKNGNDQILLSDELFMEYIVENPDKSVKQVVKMAVQSCLPFSKVVRVNYFDIAE